MAFPGRSLVLLAMVVLAAALALLLLASGGAHAQIATIVVELEDADKDQTAFPTATANDILVFDGCLTLNRPLWPPTSLQVEITIEISFSNDVDVPWEYSLDPPHHTFQASESQAFEARVTVPAGLAATVDLGPTLRFTASTSDILVYDDTEDIARVTVAQYYRITRFFSTEPLKITQGEITDFNMTVENMGNGVDTFSFIITNEAEILFAGLTVTLPSPVRLQPGEEDNVKFDMQADADATVGQFHVNITIRSDDSVSDTNYEEPVTAGAEWNVVIEQSLQGRFKDNIFWIVAIVGGLVAVVVVVVVLRRGKGSDEEEEPPKRKKKGNGPSKKKGAGPAKGKPRKRPRPPPDDDEE